ncbi:transposase domain-containing protein [Kitasatospora sp. NPDC056531]|uniref:transposase domain-containing protein n=1 Tax=Kitasatospora sp. NPDC056531 TaxID=3345856 RepID=UPI0036CB66CB
MPSRDRDSNAGLAPGSDIRLPAAATMLHRSLDAQLRSLSRHLSVFPASVSWVGPSEQLLRPDDLGSGGVAGTPALGHIGEMTRITPFEMVDEVLAETKAVQQRIRPMPARATVYLLVAGALFAGLGYRQVFDRMCVGLAGLAPTRPSGSALRQARQRLGPALKALFDLLRGPLATTAAQARWHGLLVVALDDERVGVLASGPRRRIP